MINLLLLITINQNSVPDMKGTVRMEADRYRSTGALLSVIREALRLRSKILRKKT